jgi:cellobiose phosphorylase
VLRLRLAPGQSGRVVFSTMLADTRAAVLGMADKYRDPARFERITTLSWTQAQVQLHHAGVGAESSATQHVVNVAQAHRLGGSRAQRDILHLTMARAVERLRETKGWTRRDRAATAEPVEA